MQNIASERSRRLSSTRTEMLPAQRHAMILETIRANGAASIQTLADSLNVSASTVRRDLEYLTEQDYLERTHGGAVMRRAPAARFEGEATIAAETAKTEKEAIGAVAAARVTAGQSVIFDASSTVRAAAERIAARGISITAVTNDLRAANLLMAASHVHTIVAGGTVLKGSATLIGDPGQSFLAGVHADVAFIGIHTISGRVFTETSLEVAAMKRLMICAARRVIVLADSSNFGAPSFCEICDAARVDEIIADAGAPEAHVLDLRQSGVTVTVAATPGVS